MITEILNSYFLNLDFLRRMVADLDREQLVSQPGRLVNHPAWTIGHLVYSCQQIGEEIGLEPWLEDDWRQQFGTSSTPVASPTAYPDKATLLRALHDGQKRLADRLDSMTDDDLRQPLPDVHYRDRLPTIGHAVLHILASHTAMHVGQITVWRRAMGLQAVSELRE